MRGMTALAMNCGARRAAVTAPVSTTSAPATGHTGVVLLEDFTGRAVLPGRVLLQTRRPDDPLLAEVATNDFRSFAARELELRRILSLPPFSRLVLVEASGEDETAVGKWMETLARSLRPALARQGQEALGPLPAPIAVVARRHRVHLLCKSPPESAASLRRAVSFALGAAPPPAGVRAFADVDPVDLL